MGAMLRGNAGYIALWRNFSKETIAVWGKDKIPWRWLSVNLNELCITFWIWEVNGGASVFLCFTQ